MEQWVSNQDDMEVEDDGSITNTETGTNTSENDGSDDGYSGGTVTTQETDKGVQRVNEVDPSNGMTAMEEWMQDNPDQTVVNDSSDYYDSSAGDDPTDMGETNVVDLRKDDTQDLEDNDGGADTVVAPGDSDETDNPEVTFEGDSRDEIESNAESFTDSMIDKLPTDPDEWSVDNYSLEDAAEMASDSLQESDADASMTTSTTGSSSSGSSSETIELPGIGEVDRQTAMAGGVGMALVVGVVMTR